MSAQSAFDLSRENTDLHRRLEEAEETIRALRAGEADALLVEGEQEQVYTLETAEKPYRLLVEQMPYAAATLTCDGNIIYCNRRFAEAVGQPLEALLGRPLQEFIAPVSRGQVERMLQDALQHEAGEVEGDVTLLRPDGSPIETYVGVGELQEGALGQCLMVTDLTQQRHYQELQRTQAALRASEQRLELAQRAGGIGTFEWNIQTGRVTWSAVLEELHGLPPGGFGGRYEDWQALVHPADRARTAAAANEAVTGGRDLDMEFRIVRPDGNIRWIASRGRALYQDGSEAGAGRPVRLVGISQDVTERKAAYAEREHLLNEERSARAAAERALQARDEVLGFVAHDLRNPLLAIAMGVESIRREPERPPPAQAVEVIQRCVNEMQRLIGDLLDVERLESNSLSIERGRVDVGGLLDEVCRQFAPMARSANLSLDCRLPPHPPLPAASADRDRLARVLGNLLTNAIKFTPPRGSILLTARAGEKDGEIEIAVSDTGKGIPPEQLPRVFDRFWQADRSSGGGGSGGAGVGAGAGLGLAICKGIIEAHGGRIWIESTVGVGTTARFTLPRA